MNKEKQKAIQALRDSGFSNEAKLLERIDEIKYGKLYIVVHAGKPTKIERYVKYDQLSDGM